MVIAVIIVAAGRGSRMGSARPKALLPLAGRSMLARVVETFARHPRVGPIVAVVGDPEEAGRALGAPAGVILVRGGAERQDSVRRGLEAIGSADLVLVHDAARPLLGSALIDRVIDAAAGSGAAVPATAPVDTVKEVGAAGEVARTLPRETLRLVQTPQAFRADLLRAAHERAAALGWRATDDAALVERTGARVVTVPGSPWNIKITTPDDLRLAEAILALGIGEAHDV